MLISYVDFWSSGEITTSARNIDKFSRKYPKAAHQLIGFAKEHGKQLDELLFYPVICRSLRMAVAVDRATLTVVGWLPELDNIRNLN